MKFLSCCWSVNLCIVPLFFLSGEYKSSSHYHILCNLGSHFWEYHRDQYIQSAMDKTHRRKTTFVIMISPCQVNMHCFLECEQESEWEKYTWWDVHLTYILPIYNHSKVISPFPCEDLNSHCLFFRVPVCISVHAPWVLMSASCMFQAHTAVHKLHACHICARCMLYVCLPHTCFVHVLCVLCACPICAPCLFCMCMPQMYFACVFRPIILGNQLSYQLS